MRVKSISENHFLEDPEDNMIRLDDNDTLRCIGNAYDFIDESKYEEIGERWWIFLDINSKEFYAYWDYGNGWFDKEYVKSNSFKDLVKKI